MAMESWPCLKSSNDVNLWKSVLLKISPRIPSLDNSRNVSIILDMSRSFPVSSRCLVCITEHVQLRDRRHVCVENFGIRPDGCQPSRSSFFEQRLTLFVHGDVWVGVLEIVGST
jgi:hypothetical protein